MARNSQEKLKQALILLLDEEDFDRISASHICKEAGVHRSTFYAYYDNQFKLLEEAYAYMVELFRREFETYQKDLGLPASDDFLDDSYLLPYLTFIKEHQKIYRIYLENQREFHHKDRFDSLIEHVFKPRYYAKGETNPDVIHYMSGFFLAGMTQIITTWLRRDCLESVETIASILRRCIPSSKT